MKILKHSTLTVVIFVSMFFSLGTEAVQAEVTYLGEFCFAVNPVVCPGGAPCVPINLQLGVLFYGDGHYVLNGIWSATTPIYGTGSIQDNMAMISLASSSPTSFSAWNLVLDLNTWTGTYTEMPIFPPASPVTGSFTAGAGVCP